MLNYTETRVAADFALQIAAICHLRCCHEIFWYIYRDHVDFVHATIPRHGLTISNKLLTSWTVLKNRHHFLKMPWSRNLHTYWMSYNSLVASWIYKNCLLLHSLHSNLGCANIGKLETDHGAILVVAFLALFPKLDACLILPHLYRIQNSVYIQI